VEIPIFMKTPIVLFLYVLAFQNLIGQQINCDHFIDSTKVYVNAEGMNILPGDTICLECGHRPFLQLKNFEGDSLNYITLINYGGQVLMQNDTFYAFVMNNCKYFKLTGTGDPDFEYGIKVGSSGPSTSGMSFDNLSTNFEVEHVEVCHTGFAGIMSKTNPRCDLSANRGHFTQYNTIFHDNYVHHTNGEGFYVGHSYYQGWPTTCNDLPDTLYPHEIVGLRIYDNIVDSTNYDGIQVDCAVEDCQVFGNTITNYGLADDAYGMFYGMTGIVVGGGSSGDFYNNRIEDGKGSGFFVFGLGDVYVYNNLIIRPGRSSQLTPGPPDNHHPYGIFCDDRTTVSGKSFNFINNHIISPRDIGIRIWSIESLGNRVYNNFVLDPGVKDWNIPRAFIDVIAPDGIADTLSLNNHLDSTAFDVAKNLYFKDADNGDFKSKFGSPLIDSGAAMDTVNAINFDILNVTRPKGLAYDIGCYEYLSFPTNFGVYPKNPIRCQGANMRFGVENVEHAAFGFQWLKDLLELENETDSILIIEDIGSVDVADYSVILYDAVNCDTSLVQTLSMQTPAQVFAGNDTITCSNYVFVELLGTAENYSSTKWSTLGDGIFDYDTALQVKYFMGDQDRFLGAAALTLEANSVSPCENVVLDAVVLTIDPCTMQQEIEMGERVFLFPNPLPKKTFLSFRQIGLIGEANIKIASMDGKTVFAKDFQFTSNAEVTIQKQFEPGVYAVQVQNKGNAFYSRLIVL
jgi:Right handed beta helix region/Secretion system C-terminal sorting domain